MGRLIVRGARPEDAVAVRALVERAGTLELNSTYAYLLLCDHFGGTSVVAEEDGELRGVVVGYRVPSRPDALFVWQVGVDPTARGRGLALRLLRAFARTELGRSASYLEATVAASNAASRALFTAFARAEGAILEERAGYAAPPLPLDHEPEPLLRIGPLPVPRGAVVDADDDGAVLPPTSACGDATRSPSRPQPGSRS